MCELREMPCDAEWLRRLAHYAFMYVPGPKWSESEAASKAKQAHLDGGMALALIDLMERYPEAWRGMWRELTGEPA